MRRFLRFSALNLALGYAAFGVVALASFAAPLWYAWQITLQSSRTDALHEDTQRIKQLFDHNGIAGVTAFINNRIELQIANDRILLLTDSSHHPIAGNIATWPARLPEREGTFAMTLDVRRHQTPIIFEHTVLPGGYSLLIGRDMTKYQPLESGFWYGLAGAGAMMVIVSVLGGFLLRKVLLFRIDGIAQTATAIRQGNLRQRVPVHQGSDELDMLARVINRLLDQIEQLIDSAHNVSNAIAHDLRTPLTQLRARFESLSQAPSQTDSVPAVMEAAVGNIDHVIDIFNALLRLAEIDAGLRRSGFVSIDAAQIASAAVEFYLPAAELKHISLTYQSAGAVPISGDSLLLAQAIGNLIDNALKYAPNGGSIVVASRCHADATAEITVADNGPGIADTEKSKVAQRFYRGDTSRNTPGIGLGLSLVEAVAKLHGGKLELADNNPGLCACMVVERL